MPYTFAIATTDADRQEARAFVIARGGGPFCEHPPHVMVTAIDSFRPDTIVWITGRDDDGRLVAVIGTAIHAVPGFHNLTFCGAIDQGVYTDELAVALCASMPDLLTYEGCCGDEWRWLMLIEDDGPLNGIILDTYGGPEFVTVTPQPGMPGFLRYEGRLPAARLPG